MGAIVDPSQRKSIDDYVQQAKSEGADVYQAYATMPSNGCYYPPTLIKYNQSLYASKKR